MKITGVVTEYNPFHMGHEYQLKKAREISGCDAVAVVMSGNYVQRGEPSIIDKFRRAEAAVYGGADIVIELPMPFSCQNAEMFAYAAIRELNKINVTSLSFGCENDNPEILKQAAYTQLYSHTYNKILKEEMKTGISYPNAMTNTLSTLLGDDVRKAVISPNNVLGIEYIKSAMKQDIKLDYFPVKRMGKSHNDLYLSGYFDSATAIRKGILSGNSYYSSSITPKSIQVIDNFYKEYNGFNNLNNYLNILYYKIIDLGIDGLGEIFEVTEGLNNKIYDNLYKYTTMDDFIMSLKSKRYTYSKLRRAIMNIILNIKREDINDFMLPSPFNYVKVLAFNDVGRKVIKLAQNNKTAVINRYSDYRKYNINAKDLSVFKLTNKATDLYYLPFKDSEINLEFKQNAVYVQNK